MSMRDEIANCAGSQDMNEDEGWELSQLTDIAWGYLDEPPNWVTKPLGVSHMKKATNLPRGFKSYVDDQLFAKLGEAAAQIAIDKLCLGAR